MRARWTTVAAAVAVATALQVGCAEAQGPATGSAPAGGIRVERPPLPFHHGISFTVAPVVRPDGSVWAAEPPVVTAVAPGSPAARVGIEPGDVILQVNGQDARDARLLRVRENGQEFTLRIRRGTELRDVTVVSAPNPRAEGR